LRVPFSCKTRFCPFLLQNSILSFLWQSPGGQLGRRRR
jgi:hypothetical protein